MEISVFKTGTRTLTTLSYLACTIAFACGALPARAQTETVLYSFTGGTDGAGPYAQLIRDHQGNLYGTTVNGGVAGLTTCYPTCGTVFKLTNAGQYSVLYSFTGGNDGANPYGGLVQDQQGNLYGTTTFGGFFFGGTVFKLNSSGAETLLYTFEGSLNSDSGVPFSSLVRDAKGNLYGTSFSGGAVSPSTGGYGTIFEVSASGTESILYSFAASPDADYPFGGLIRTDKGDFYGTTVFGGAYNQGTIFKLDSAGNESVLYSFIGGADGGVPSFGLIQDQQGSFYGTTTQGGSSSKGAVFKFTEDGGLQVLYSFKGGADGATPTGIVLDNKKNIYGTTNQGGANGYGTVYVLNSAGQETVLHTFAGLDGAYPTNGVVRDQQGNLYGTTNGGGAYGFGTIFKIAMN